MISGYGKVRAEGYSHTLKALENDINALRTDLKNLSKSVKSGSKEKYSDIANWFQEATRDVKARERLGGAMDTVRDTSRRAAYKTRSSIEKRPFVSIASALAIGMGIAMLVRYSRK